MALSLAASSVVAPQARKAVAGRAGEASAKHSLTLHTCLHLENPRPQLLCGTTAAGPGVGRETKLSSASETALRLAGLRFSDCGERCSRPFRFSRRRCWIPTADE